MRIAKSKEDLRASLKDLRAPSDKVVLVPTMGALHEGHASLLRHARDLAGDGGLVVATVFLNPTQFNNAQDLDAYPTSPEADVLTCESCGVDLLFMPNPDVMYVSDHSMLVEETSLSTTLCGETRPGHFAGVCLVVLKLMNLVQPTDAVFGQKDYQQLAILRRMQRDLDIPVLIHAAATVRAADGLALSSRNARLSPAQRAEAPMIRQALLAAKSDYETGLQAPTVLASCRAQIEMLTGVSIDYIKLLDASTLKLVTPQSCTLVLAVAVFFGDVRLIDNIELQNQG